MHIWSLSGVVNCSAAWVDPSLPNSFCRQAFERLRVSPVINLIMEEPVALSTCCSWAAFLGGMAGSRVQVDTVKSFSKVNVPIHTPG